MAEMFLRTSGHMRDLLPACAEKRHKSSQSRVATKLLNRLLSHFRIFCGWIGKKGMVKSLRYYLPHVPAAELRVCTVAKTSKSWAESGIDVREKVKEAMDLDWRFGLMILAQVSFGLRRIEVIQLQPWKNHEGDKIHIRKTKGGRPRDIYIETDAQREILEFIKSKLKASETLGWTHRTDGSKASPVPSLENGHEYFAPPEGQFFAPLERNSG